jgi:hypothetical protein
LVIWTRWGILLIPVIALCNGVVMSLWFDVFHFQDNQPFIANLGYLFSFSLAGLISWFIGTNLNNRSKGQVYINKRTGQEISLDQKHTFFFIRMELWGVILPVIGIIIYIVASIQS